MEHDNTRRCAAIDCHAPANADGWCSGHTRRPDGTWPMDDERNGRTTTTQRAHAEEYCKADRFNVGAVRCYLGKFSDADKAWEAGRRITLQNRPISTP